MVKKTPVIFLLLSLLVFAGCSKEIIVEEPVVSESQVDLTGIEELIAKAESGDSSASFKLGRVFDYGLMDQNQDYNEAFNFYQLAREQGEPLGSLALGYMYLNGAGVDKNLSEAMNYFTEAYDSGIEEGEVGIGLVFMDPDYEEHDDRNAYVHFITASDKGNPDGLYYISYLRETGRGCNIDPIAALEGYTKVSETPTTEDPSSFNTVNLAETRLGLMYYRGVGTERDYDTAIDYLNRASDRGFSMARYYLGYIYETGDGDHEPDYERALSLYEESAAGNYAPALNKIGYMYCNGVGVDIDYSQALYFQERAAAQNYAPAQVNLGYLYENGLGCTKSLETALSYYRMALRGGYEGAGAAILRVNNEIAEEAGEAPE